MTDTSEFGVFDFQLSADEEERARRVHAESIVVDMMYYGPCGYRCFTAEMTEILKAEWNQHHDGWMAFTSAYLLPLRMGLQDGGGELEAHWRASGITGGNREVPLDFIETPFRDTVRTVGMTIALFDRMPWMRKVLQASDFRAAKEEGKFAGYMNAQMTAGLYRLELLDVAHDLGIRMMMLTYNNQNFIGSGCQETQDSGLSDLGVRFVRRMNELGIIVDTSHCGKKTTLDACAKSSKPVVASHVGADAVYSHVRNKDDEELRAIANSGGIVGIVALPSFLSGDAHPTVSDMLDHIDHVASTVGWQHVGVGTDHPLMSDKWTLAETSELYHEQLGFRGGDFGDATLNLVGFDDHRDSVNLARGLLKRGYTDEQIHGILGENFVRVFAAVCG